MSIQEQQSEGNLKEDLDSQSESLSASDSLSNSETDSSLNKESDCKTALIADEVECLKFECSYSEYENDVYLREYNYKSRIPPKELNFGDSPLFEPLDKFLEKELLEKIDSLPIFHPTALFKPESEKFNYKNIFSYDFPKKEYELEMERDFHTLKLRDNLISNPINPVKDEINLVDSTHILNMIENAERDSPYPKFVNKKSYETKFDFRKFMSVLDEKSKEVTEKVYSRNPEDYSDMNSKLLSKKIPALTESDLFDIKRRYSDDEFLQILTESNENSKNENNQAKLRQKMRNPMAVYVREIEFRENVYQFETLRKNMAFNYPFELDPFQKEAILLIEQQQNVLVSAHTSAGKTVVAEYAIAMSLKHGMKTIYTSPIKALSNQKYKDFRETFDSVGIVTGDIQLNPSASCVIMTTEILRSMVYNSSHSALANVEWIIFDEVHYINDENRGVVWEELLILLPREIKLVLLSATFPNCIDFANWVGYTRRQLIHVIATSKRPVPLEHYLYSATNRQSLNNCFLVLDKNNRFYHEGCLKAKWSFGKEKDVKKSDVKVFDKRRPQAKLMNSRISCMLEYLNFNEKLPAIIFVFSRQKCLQLAQKCMSDDFTTKVEKSKILSFFDSCVNRLSNENASLPQIILMRQLVEKGIAVHHSGILPILREIVELLYQRSLIKILFATETFSIGVNMPAKTVVFLSLNKPSQNGRRDLYTSEYIQMAGRAGRRGQDSIGLVFIMVENEEEIENVESIISGEPFMVKSKFCLTYGMILRIVSDKSKNIEKVEDFMRSSFSEYVGGSKLNIKENIIETIDNLTENVDELTSKLNSCNTCKDNILVMCNSYNLFQSMQLKAHTVLLSATKSFKSILSTGRICLIKISKTEYTIGAITKEIDSFVIVNNNFHSRGIPFVLFIGDSESFGHIALSKVLAQEVKSDYPYLFMNNIKVSNKSRVYFVNVDYKNIILFTNDKLDVFWDKNMKDKRILDNKENSHKRSGFVSDIHNQLLSFVDELNLSTIKNVFKIHHPAYSKCFEETTLFDDYFSHLEKIIGYGNENSNFMNCEHINSHYDYCSEIRHLEDKICKLNYRMSDDSLQLLPEYNKRLTILTELGFIDKSKKLTLKGRIACNFRCEYDIVLTELLLSKELLRFEPPYIAACLSCFLKDQKPFKTPDFPTLDSHLQEIWDLLLRIEKIVDDAELANDMPYNKRFINPLRIEIVYLWATGVSFTNIVERFDIAEGELVREILRLDEVCCEMEVASLYAGNAELSSRVKKTRELIHKDIVFTPSLYLT